MLKIQEFYSLAEWKEYADTFMGNAAIQVDDRFVKAVTSSGQVLGQWGGTLDNRQYGLLKERRCNERLAKVWRYK